MHVYLYTCVCVWAFVCVLVVSVIIKHSGLPPHVDDGYCKNPFTTIIIICRVSLLLAHLKYLVCPLAYFFFPLGLIYFTVCTSCSLELETGGKRGHWWPNLLGSDVCVCVCVCVEGEWGRGRGGELMSFNVFHHLIHDSIWHLLRDVIRSDRPAQTPTNRLSVVVFIENKDKLMQPLDQWLRFTHFPSAVLASCYFQFHIPSGWSFVRGSTVLEWWAAKLCHRTISSKLQYSVQYVHAIASNEHKCIFMPHFHDSHVPESSNELRQHSTNGVSHFIY